MTQEEFIKYTERMNKNIASLLKGNEEELAFYSQLVESFNRICDEKYKMEDKINKAINIIEENMYSYYDNNGEKCIEETVFERSANPKELLNILKEK
jgi:hypothetical protein